MSDRWPGEPFAAPVAHSILDAPPLGRWVAERYGLPNAVHAQLLSHGQNDWYRLESSAGRWALRVVKAHARSAAQLREELQWLAALGADFPVARPLTDLRGETLQSLQSPEGLRHAALYPWIDGVTLDRSLGESDASEAGRLLARLHGHPAQLASPGRRHDLEHKLSATGQMLDAALSGLAERARIREAREVAGRALRSGVALPHASLHGDLHFGNLRRDDRGRLWLLDFDDCGRGPLCADLTAFAWRLRCEQLPEPLEAAFLSGYESERALSDTERRLLPGFHVARALYLAGVLARDRDRLGSVPGFDRPWPHYLALVDRAVADARSCDPGLFTLPESQR
jgi:Ser/Thr protein kinase RdoA (MazF antagonist)